MSSEAATAKQEDAPVQMVLLDALGTVRPLLAGRPFRSAGGLGLRDGRLFHSDPPSQARLEKLLRTTLAKQRGSISIRDGEGLSLRIRMEKIATRPERLVIATIEQRSMRSQVDPDDLRALFGITGQQARVLQLLCDSIPPIQCAELLGCSEATIRSHIANLKTRMGCSTQTQLVRSALLLA